MNSAITSKPRFDIDTCLDILDWFNDDYLGYLNHILISKLDGDERVIRALPFISDYCERLVNANLNTPKAYPLAS